MVGSFHFYNISVLLEVLALLCFTKNKSYLCKLFKIDIYMESQNVIFCGNRVFAIIIKEVIVN